MQTGSILSINMHGVAQVQLDNRVVDAQILSGGANIGDRVSGPMEVGIQSWQCAANRTIVVSVHRSRMQARQLMLQVA